MKKNLILLLIIVLCFVYFSWFDVGLSKYKSFEFHDYDKNTNKNINNSDEDKKDNTNTNTGTDSKQNSNSNNSSSATTNTDNGVNKNTHTNISKSMTISDVGDITYIDLAFSSWWTSGDYDTKTGETIESGRRFRLINPIEVTKDKYDVNLSTDCELTIFEYDSNKKFISSKTLNDKSIYSPNKTTKYFKVSIHKKTNEKSMSAGQWDKAFAKKIIINFVNGDKDKLINSWKGNLAYTSSGVYSGSTLANLLFKNDSYKLANSLLSNQINNNTYSLTKDELNNGNVTLFFANDGNDNNSGLSPLYPKKSPEKYKRAYNVNILLKSGDTFNLPTGFTLGSNTIYSTYGGDKRAIISFYKKLNTRFEKLSGYTNIWVADISSMSNGKTDKSNCNIGQLLINGKVNWNRYVWGSDNTFNPNTLVQYNNDGWAVDWKTSKLYMYTSTNPNNLNIYYAPSGHGINLNGVSNVVFKGLELKGAGMHGISLKNVNNVKINNNYIHDIGGSVLTSAGIRYGNAIQLWDSGSNVEVEYNISDWIFDTCYTNQGSDKEALEKNVKFNKNIGMHSFWGIEVWGDGWSNKEFSNIEYNNNIMYSMMDITNPTRTMYTLATGRLLYRDTYISYRGGYQYHQMSNLNINNSGKGEVVRVNNNVFWNTNRFIAYLHDSRGELSFPSLNNNLFYVESGVSNAALFRYEGRGGGKSYLESIDQYVNSSNKTSIYHKDTPLNNSSDLQTLYNLFDFISNN